MSKQTTVMGCDWTVGEGDVQNPETGEKRKSRLAIFTELSTGEVFVFPLPEESGIEFGQVMSADDPQAEMDKIQRRHETEQKLAISREPSAEELAGMAAASRGEIPNVPPGGPDRRPKPPHKQ